MSSFDKLTIETPEQTSLDFPLAGIGSRFLAMAADTAIQTVTAGLIVIVIAFATPGFAWIGKMAPQWAIAFVVLAIYFIYAGYFAFFEAIWNGQTPGKRYAKLRVMKDDGRPIGVYDAIARNLMRAVDSLPFAYGVGVVSIALSKNSKRLGDFVAGTVVVHEKTLEGARPFLETKHDEAAPVYDTTSLTPDELRLIETFFSRRDSLEPAIRTSMAAQIANRVGGKLQVRVMGWPQTERFLETVFEQYRSTGRFGRSGQH
ncbi:MAG TPA: RDD family protein [Candidatus Limnocylindrales bacterium]|nr:RDD family protein [Candidatus Limnocylindrales bacterium]